MAESELDALLARMPDIALAVNSFTSEAVQQTALAALIAAFSGNTPKQLDEDTSLEGTETGGAPANDKQMRKSRSPRKTRPSDSSDPRPGLDETALVNAIKEDARFDRFKAKIILGSANKTQQVKFISWFSGETPITSGNMQRALSLLGVRISAGQASTAVSGAKSDFITTPGIKPATFRLSTRAHSEYEKWLLNDDAAK
jgi:hypothetical protein